MRTAPSPIVSRGHVIRGGIPRRLAVSGAWHKSGSPSSLVKRPQVLTGVRPIDTIPPTSPAEVRRTLASQNQESGAQLRLLGLATQDPRIFGCVGASGN